MVRRGIFYLGVVLIIVGTGFIGYYSYLYFNSAPVVDFDYQQVAQVGEEVTFLNTSSIKDASMDWSWAFGDQEAAASSVSAKYIFQSPGRYVVKLTLNEGGQKLQKQKIIQITVPRLKSAFDVEASSLGIGDTLTISNNSQNATEFVWLLGDGRSEVERQPSITYNSKGDYKLTLVAINDIGQMDEYSLDIKINVGEVASNQVAEDEVIVKHIAIFNRQSLSDAFSRLANTGLPRAGKRKIRNDILRDVESINILIEGMTLENYINKIQLEASSNRVDIVVSDIQRNSDNKIVQISIN